MTARFFEVVWNVEWMNNFDFKSIKQKHILSVWIVHFEKSNEFGNAILSQFHHEFDFW